MSQESDSDLEELRCIRSGKRYKVDLEQYLTNYSHSTERDEIQSHQPSEEEVGHIP